MSVGQKDVEKRQLKSPEKSEAWGTGDLGRGAGSRREFLEQTTGTIETSR